MAIPTVGTRIHASTAAHPRDSDRPPFFSHLKQIAQTVAPPSVSTQQSPQTGCRQRAHGPAAFAPQMRQSAGEPPPSTGMSPPDTSPL